MRIQGLAPAKVNLCLFLGPPREDRRHELVTLIEPLSLADELTLETVGEGPDEVSCRGVEEPNLAARALAALRSQGWKAPPVRLTIDKRIPVAAGMGGGSSDAAATVRLAAELARVPADVAAGVAASLGSDVPALLHPGVVLATGAGEVVEPVPPLAPHAFAIVPQPFGLSTEGVYAQADRLALPRARGELAARHRELVGALTPGAQLPEVLLVNDLQRAAVSLAPALEGVLDAVLAAGADHCTVCGSGPTVAGLFWGPEARERAGTAAASLAYRYPGTVATWPPSDSGSAGASPHLRGGAQSAGVG